MADWIVCPGCLLKHTRRSDGHCPRCGRSIDGTAPVDSTPNVPATPSAIPPPKLLPPETGDVPLGARIAAIVMIANALAVFAERLVMPAPSGITGSPVSGVIDLWIGGSLLAGKPKYLTWARLRVVLGLLFFGGIWLYRGDVTQAVIQAAFSIGLLLLLIGNPARVRIGAGVTLAGACFALEAVGLAAEATGVNPLAYVLQAGRYESTSLSVLRGERVPYEITLRPGWLLLKPDVMRRENPVLDRWISKPAQDVHVLVIAEEVPAGSTIDMDLFEKVFLDQAKAGAKSFRVAARPSVRSAVADARFVHTIRTLGDAEMEGYAGLYARDNQAVQVLAFSAKRHFASHEKEFRELLGSFAFRR